VHPIIAIRHAPIAEAQGHCYGRTDWTMSATRAHADAAALRPQLPDWPIISSPLQRCLQLAVALSTQPLSTQAPRIEPRLIEMDFGGWEGRAWSDISRATLDAWATDIAHFAPPAGEAFADVILRLRSALHDLPTPAIWITHAGVIRGLHHLCDGLPLAQAAAREVAHLTPFAFKPAR